VPEFEYPAYVVYALSSESDSLAPALAALREVAAASMQ